MKKETIHEHARRVPELNYRAQEYALSEGKSFDEVEPEFLLLSAEMALNAIDDWGPQYYNPRELHRQKVLLRNFLKKWEGVKQ